MNMRGNVSESEKLFWLGLKMIPFLQRRIYSLVEKAGGPRELWETNVKELEALGIPGNVASDIVAARNTIDLDTAYGELQKKGIWIVSDADDAYPDMLRQTPGHPRAMFVKGTLEKHGTAVAIVGSRRATTYGKAIAMELATSLAKAGVLVVSGVARGIDTVAHRGTVEAGGLTFGVLGCGIDITYPPENKKLYDDICAHGALISEYSPGTPPFSFNFPARNRIVAGLCHGVVVVEAGERSGALITADFALDYGRDVFAVPGNSKSATSRGANSLIKQGAYLVESAEDILTVLGVQQKPASIDDRLTDTEKELLCSIGWEAKRIDEIAHELRGSIATISTHLLSLEIAGYIKKDITGAYIRIK